MGAVTSFASTRSRRQFDELPGLDLVQAGVGGEDLLGDRHRAGHSARSSCSVRSAASTYRSVVQLSGVWLASSRLSAFVYAFARGDDDVGVRAAAGEDAAVLAT